MEKYSLLGVPYPLIGFFCFILAAVFLFVWPKSRAKELQKLNFPKFVLHYFHPMAWVLIGMGAFWQKVAPEIAITLAGLGALAFIMFVFIFVRSQ
jgi:hypothetical protein